MINHNEQEKLISQSHLLENKKVLTELVTEVEQMKQLFEQKYVAQKQAKTFDSAEFAIINNVLNGVTNNEYKVNYSNDSLNNIYHNITQQLERDPNITNKDVKEYCERLNNLSNACEQSLKQNNVNTDIKERFCDNVKEVIEQSLKTPIKHAAESAPEATPLLKS